MSLDMRAKWRLTAIRILREWRSNIIVWLVQWIGGSAIMSAIGHALWREFHRAPLDWYFVGVVFVVGLVLVVIGVWLQQKQAVSTEDKLKEIEAKIPSITVNDVPVAGPAKAATGEVFGVIINYPVPRLRQEVLSMCSELEGFAGAHGKQPKPERHPQESDGDFLQRWRTIVEPWRARFVGDYRLKFGDSVSRMRDTIRAKTGIEDGALNASIEKADNPNVSADAVHEIIRRLWDIAAGINA